MGPDELPGRSVRSVRQLRAPRQDRVDPGRPRDAGRRVHHRLRGEHGRLGHRHRRRQRLPALHGGRLDSQQEIQRNGIMLHGYYDMAPIRRTRGVIMHTIATLTTR